MLTSSPGEDVDDEALVRRFPGEPVSHDNAAHYRGRLQQRLLVNRCASCELWHHPPKPVCPRCWSSGVDPTPVSGDGTIFMTVFLHQGPPAEGVDYAEPYPVVTVELAEQSGLRFTSTVVAGTPIERVVIGARVALDWTTRHDSPLPVFSVTEGPAK
jgi:uncharacterized OB-fold protein